MITNSLPLKTFIHELVTHELSGLCETCVNQNFCTYRMYSDKTVLQCELFEIEQTPQLAVLYPNNAHHEKTLTHLNGLCTNCTYLSTCQLPKAIGGVWHCEEYK